MDRTGVVPPSLKNMPESKPENVWYFDMYNSLSRFRSWNEGVPDPVSLSDIFALLNEFGIFDCEYRLFLVKLMGEMDNAYIHHFAEKHSQKIQEIKSRRK